MEALSSPVGQFSETATYWQTINAKPCRLFPLAGVFWENCSTSFLYSTTMYVHENTGDTVSGLFPGEKSSHG
jgi:hypothetical protein